MKKKYYYMVLDTETCPLDREKEGVDPKNSLVYDIGWLITDRKGNVVKRRSFVVNEIFFGEYERMQSAYYANKIPQYFHQIGKGHWLPRMINQIRYIMLNDMKEYNIKAVCAYNARFDYHSLNTTYSFLNLGKWFFPRGTQIYDIWGMAKDTICTKKSYAKFCVENGFLTTNGRLKTSAETVYRYLINKPTYYESHTGLDDCEIEKEIMIACFKMKKKMKKELW